MKKAIEKWLVNKLLKGGGFYPKDIKMDKKEIHTGLWGIAYNFCEPFQKLIISILVHWFGYACYQTVLLPTLTWCSLGDNSDKIHERWLEFVKEYRDRAKTKDKAAKLKK